MALTSYRTATVLKSLLVAIILQNCECKISSDAHHVHACCDLLQQHLKASLYASVNLADLLPDSQAQVDVGMPSHSVDFSPDGSHLAIGGVNGSVKVLIVR